MSIGKVVKMNREKLGWTQEELAKKLGISVSTVGMIETDKRNVKDSIKYQLCSLFNISISELMGENELDKLQAKIISAFIRNKVTKIEFTEIKKAIYKDIYEENYKPNKNKKYIEIRNTILYLSPSNQIGLHLKERQKAFVKEHKEEILNIIESISYEDLNFNNTIDVYSQNQIRTKAEINILKNPFDEQNEYFALKIDDDKMTPKYEIGNIAIIQKEDMLLNSQDVCFISKRGYSIGRMFINNETVCIQYLNSQYGMEFFSLEEFKKIYKGIVISIRFKN